MKKDDGFYKFLSKRFKHDNNIWDYIEELWREYSKEPFKNNPPSVENAIKAIEEKGKLGLPKSQSEYKNWAKKMDEIDKKYNFIKE